MPIPQKYFSKEEQLNAMRESRRKYYLNNREKCLERARKYSKEHYDPEKKRAYYLQRKQKKLGISVATQNG